MRLISARSVVRIHLSPPKKKWAMESGYTSSLIRYGDLEKVGCMTIYLNKELLRYIGRQTAEGTMTTK